MGQGREGQGLDKQKTNKAFILSFLDAFAHSCPLDSEVCKVFVFANVLVALEHAQRSALDLTQGQPASLHCWCYGEKRRSFSLIR